MASSNNRLRYLIPAHKKSETDRRGNKSFLRSKQDPYRLARHLKAFAR